MSHIISIVNRISIPTLGSIVLMVVFMVITLCVYFFVEKKRLLIYVLLNLTLMTMFTSFFLWLLNAPSPQQAIDASKGLYTTLLFDVVVIMYTVSFAIEKKLYVLKGLAWSAAIFLSGIILFSHNLILTEQIIYTHYNSVAKGPLFILLPGYSLVVCGYLIYEFLLYRNQVDVKTFRKVKPVLVGLIFFVAHTTFIAFTTVMYPIFKPTNYINVMVMTICFTLYYYNDLKDTMANNTALYQSYIYDDLTHIHTRTYSINHLEEMLKNRYITHSYVAIMDIDGFKEVNDVYGHLLGDQALEMFGGLLNAVKLGSKVAGRLGGDEFILIFDELVTKDVTTTLEQLIHSYIYGLIEMGVDVIETGSGLSVGVLRIEGGMTVKGVLSIADQAMYEAKQSGKNKVVYYG